MTPEQLAIIVIAAVAVLCGVTCMFVAAGRQADRATAINDRATVVNEQATKTNDRATVLMDRNEALQRLQAEQLNQFQAILDRCEVLMSRLEQASGASQPRRDQH